MWRGLSEGWRTLPLRDRAAFLLLVPCLAGLVWLSPASGEAVAGRPPAEGWAAAQRR
jgi:hypothetical protein